MATSTQNQALEEQRSHDLGLAKASTNPAGKANDLRQASALRGQITANAKSANQASAAVATPTAPAAIDPVTGYAYGSAGDTQVLAAQTTTNTNNAVQSISSTLSGLGLSAMSSWATATVSALVGKGIDPTTAVNTVISQMNDPQNADGSTNEDALNAFNAALPGFNQLIANTGSNGSPGSSPAQAIANYINYGTQVQAFETQAGLVPGTISAQTIGNLWANQVSSTEVSQRVTDATVAASNAPQAVQNYMSQNFLGGASATSALASYFLNPTNTMQTITQNMNTSTVGGEAAISGFSQNLSVAQASALGAFLANGSTAGSATGIGGVNSVTAGAANNAFSSNLGGGVSGSAAQLAGLETASPGQNASGTVSENELLSAIGVPGEGTTQAQALIGVSNAQQTRTAGARGGGGAATTSNGAAGLGFAQS